MSGSRKGDIAIFRLILIDHDDTAVDSTASIHYPAHREAMRQLRPGLPAPTLDDWFLANFEPGIMEYLVHGVGLTREELGRELEIWRSFTSTRVASFFPGFRETLVRFREKGGRVVVISHSEAPLIERDYRLAGSPPFMPDLVFGWTDDPGLRKPNPWPVLEALRQLALEPEEAIVLDDLRPGVLMARAAGVAAAGAGWAHRVPAIREWMRANCVAWFERVEEFAQFLLY